MILSCFRGFDSTLLCLTCNKIPLTLSCTLYNPFDVENNFILQCKLEQFLYLLPNQSETCDQYKNSPYVKHLMCKAASQILIRGWFDVVKSLFLSHATSWRLLFLALLQIFSLLGLLIFTHLVALFKQFKLSSSLTESCVYLFILLSFAVIEQQWLMQL